MAIFVICLFVAIDRVFLDFKRKLAGFLQAWWIGSLGAEVFNRSLRQAYANLFDFIVINFVKGRVEGVIVFEAWVVACSVIAKDQIPAPIV